MSALASAPIPDAEPADDWVRRNQVALIEDIAEVRGALQRHLAEGLGTQGGPGSVPRDRHGELRVARLRSPGTERSSTTPPEPMALDVLSALFALSPFERAILAMCAGVELDASLAGLCASANGSDDGAYATFSLALGALDGAHWSAVSPNGPLRQWRLVELVQQPPLAMTVWPLRIDERILHYLAGVDGPDERLVGSIQPVELDRDMADSHHELAHRQAATRARDGETLPVIQLCGATEPSRRAIAATMASDFRLGLWALDPGAVPGQAHELEGFVRLWDREAALASLALYVDVDAVEPGEAAALATLAHLAARTRAPLFVGARESWRMLRRRSVIVDVPRPSHADQRRLWTTALGAKSTTAIDALVAQFDLDAATIRSSTRDALASGDEPLEDALWAAGRRAARATLDDLAQRLDSLATWDDLVLPDRQHRQLHEIVDQVTHRTTVYEHWGFGARGTRGLGINALFVGASGTGKTLAAEVMAGALSLDLYRIDLSSVVSKYIGETEKNLRRVFDAAEDGGAILFFDEADALFGKRSEVKDSHDRYANIEVNYLLQRMEAYRGVAILATNLKGALDTAFLRRIRFVVTFPMPDRGQRAEIWRRSFPLETPTEDLDVATLSRLDVAGGNIRNIAMNAAFLAAAAGTPVRMAHIARATRAEFQKLDRPLTEPEIGGAT